MRKLDFLNTALKTGMGEYLDYISFHEYTHDENQLSRHEITTGSFENAHGKAFAYWYPSNRSFLHSADLLNWNKVFF